MADLTWYGWLLVILWAVNALHTIDQVGKERKGNPVTARTAMFSVATSAAFIVGVLTVGVNS